MENFNNRARRELGYLAQGLSTEYDNTKTMSQDENFEEIFSKFVVDVIDCARHKERESLGTKYPALC